MTTRRCLGSILPLVMLASITILSAGRAQQSAVAAWADTLLNTYRIFPDITYLTANNYDAKLDVYALRRPRGRAPALLYIHGGGWEAGEKESTMLHFLPYLHKGWVVVSVEYRRTRVSLAPAAVEDCRCALRWMYTHAQEYSIDTTKIVVTGHSAGGHLALTTGMVPVSAGLDRQCIGGEGLKVAAIINWFGITDVADLLDGPNMQTYAVRWLGSMTDRLQVAQRVSPLTYVRKGLPPILTVHGDEDTVVPYSHAVRLHEALDNAGVPNELVTIHGGKHGGFKGGEFLRAYAAIDRFLLQHGILEKDQ
jgi:acetyl esterase/lipase